VLIDLALTLNCFHKKTIKWKTHVDTWPAKHGQRFFVCVWFMAFDTAEINQSPLFVQTKRRLRTVHKGMWEMYWIALTHWSNHYKRIKNIYFVSVSLCQGISYYHLMCAIEALRW